MKVTRVSAEVMVSDHENAVAWYERLLGRPPDDQPMEGLAEWQLTDTGWLQVFAKPGDAGRSALTIGVDDLEGHAAELTDRGIDLDRQTTPRGQHIGSVNDPDNNLIIYAQDV